LDQQQTGLVGGIILPQKRKEEKKNKSVGWRWCVLPWWFPRGMVGTCASLPPKHVLLPFFYPPSIRIIIILHQSIPYINALLYLLLHVSIQI
jgi:hypothetical protein